MRAVVLCPGPSLAGLSQDVRRNAGVVIAVNRAAVGGCDWLVAYDAHALAEFRGFALAGAVTLHENAAHCDVSMEGIAAMGWEDMVRLARPYSKLGALVFAASLGCDDVRLVGDDMDGSRYCDGAHSPWANDMRWHRERESTGALIAALSERGVTVGGGLTACRERALTH